MERAGPGREICAQRIEKEPGLSASGNDAQQVYNKPQTLENSIAAADGDVKETIRQPIR